MENYDAIVVGAGPAGSAAALFIADANNSVLLLDKSSFPREKVCGDAFSGKSIGVMRELGLIEEIQKFQHGKVCGISMTAPNGKSITVAFPKADGMDIAGYTIRRQDLDSIFFNAAKQHKNIRAITGFTLQGLLKNESGAVIGAEGAGADGIRQSFKSRVVVGADGAASAVSRLLGFPTLPLEHVYSAVRGYYRGIEGLTENIELFFIDGVLPGYLWIFPMGDGLANVGLGILSSDLQKGRKHPAVVLADAVANHPALCGRFKGSTLEGKIGGWSIPNGSFRKKLYGEGWVLVGDAASLVDPFSGEGVGNALSSGKFAANAINLALSQSGDGPISASSLSSYSLRVDRELRPEMENSYKIQRLSRFRFLLNLFIGKAATKPKARQMINDMFASEEGKKKVESPLTYLEMLLP